MNSNILVKFDNGSNLTCTVVATEIERAQGLKNHERLPVGHGMMFFYEEPKSFLMFWNKDVKFDIEVIYIDSNLIIAGIDFLKEDSSDISISTKLTKYVIEVAAGTCKDLGLKVGIHAIDFIRLENLP